MVLTAGNGRPFVLEVTGATDLASLEGLSEVVRAVQALEGLNAKGDIELVGLKQVKPALCRHCRLLTSFDYLCVCCFLLSYLCITLSHTLSFFYSLSPSRWLSLWVSPLSLSLVANGSDSGQHMASHARSGRREAQGIQVRCWSPPTNPRPLAPPLPLLVTQLQEGIEL